VEGFVERNLEFSTSWTRCLANEVLKFSWDSCSLPEPDLRRTGAASWGERLMIGFEPD
jgi:hypothetical protein